MRRLERVVVVLVTAAGAAFAADDDAGRRLATTTCASCHGANGLSVRPDAPNLAGQPADYLAAQLRAYRAGTRRNEVMSVVAKPLTDEQVAALAAWFAAIRVEATPP
jgi:cytochrome c553